MTRRTFHYADSDGDTLTASTLDEEDAPNKVRLVIGAGGAYTRTVFLTAEAVTALRAALSQHDPTANAPAPGELKVGGEAIVTGDTADMSHRVPSGTVVTLKEGPTPRGNWYCHAEGVGWWYVAPADLAPLTDETGPDLAEVVAREAVDAYRVAAFERATDLVRDTSLAGVVDPEEILEVARFIAADAHRVN